MCFLRKEKSSIVLSFGFIDGKPGAAEPQEHKQIIEYFGFNTRSKNNWRQTKTDHDKTTNTTLAKRCFFVFGFLVEFWFAWFSPMAVLTHKTTKTNSGETGKSKQLEKHQQNSFGKTNTAFPQRFALFDLTDDLFDLSLHRLHLNCTICQNRSACFIQLLGNCSNCGWLLTFHN